MSRKKAPIFQDAFSPTNSMFKPNYDFQPNLATIHIVTTSYGLKVVLKKKGREIFFFSTLFYIWQKHLLKSKNRHPTVYNYLFKPSSKDKEKEHSLTRNAPL